MKPAQEKAELRNRDWVLMTLFKCPDPDIPEADWSFQFHEQIHSLYALATLNWVMSLVSKRILMETWFWFSRNLVLRSGR